LPEFAEHDRPLIECLHRMVFNDPDCTAAIEAGLRRADKRFADSGYTSTYSSVTLPIELFSDKMPEPFRPMVRLCRAFTIRAGQRAPHEEIHRNSVQRLVSFRGEGAVNCAMPGGLDRAYTRRQIVSPDSAQQSEIAMCWDVVPGNTWHFPEARGADQWYGVAFHSASADDIIDEYVGN
jgi:hypothetical protein